MLPLMQLNNLVSLNLGFLLQKIFIGAGDDFKPRDNQLKNVFDANNRPSHHLPQLADRFFAFLLELGANLRRHGLVVFA